MALRRGLTNRQPKGNAQATTVRAAHGGMDGRVSLADYDANIAIYTYNLISDEYGMKVRKGYAEHCIGLDRGLSTLTGVKTLIPFVAATGDVTDDRLFAVTNEGIWNVSEYDSPTLDITFTNRGGDSGNGVYTQYNTDAAATLVFYADPENGLFTYTQATDTWAQTPDFTGLIAAEVSSIALHKQRIWLVKRNSGDAYYLDIGAVAGAATKFQFGSKFKRGGRLVGVYNWTIDGGTGVDDYLVGISSAGDVIPYQGEDPEATGSGVWEQRGVYFVGNIVGGSKCASEFGGDLHILSSFGVTPLSTLIRGQDASTAPDGIGAKTTFYLREDVRANPNGVGWATTFLPSQGSVVISTPKRSNGVFIQYAYDVNRETFGWWRGVPAICFAEWRNKTYFGTLDGKVSTLDQELDDRRITPVNPDNGLPIEFSSLFAFSGLDSAGRFKRGTMIRPDFVSQSPLAYQAKFAYDYAIVKFSTSVSQNEVEGGVWDIGVWDNAIWGSQDLKNRTKVIGTFGLGRTLAVAIQGSAKSETYLMSYDVIWNTGGIL